MERVNLTREPATVGDELLQPLTLAVRENYYRGTFGTLEAKSRRRSVLLSDSVVAALGAFRLKSKFKGSDDLVFASRKGSPLNENSLARRILKPIAKELGMPWLSWHVIPSHSRHFGEQIGMTLSDRQAQMGHGDVRITVHYTHADLERRGAGIEVMADGLVGESPAIIN